MKYDGQIETYRFIGDSTVNKVKRMVKGEPTETYTQTDIINQFSNNKHLVCGGSKLFASKNDSRMGYIIYFGKEKSNPDQIIKIVVDKEMIEKGDINALAIDSLCQYSIRVNKKNNKKMLVGAIAGTLGGLVVAGAIVGSLIWADSKEQKMEEDKINDHRESLKQQMMEDGTYKSWLEEQGLLDEESVNEVLNPEQTNGRSY